MMGVYQGRILGGIAGEYRMQFMKCPQTTIFSGRACCGRLLDYHIARHGGRYSSFLDRFPNTHTHTEGGRGGRVGADWAAAPSPQGGSAAARERAEGRAREGGRARDRKTNFDGGRQRERARAHCGAVEGTKAERRHWHDDVGHDAPASRRTGDGGRITGIRVA